MVHKNGLHSVGLNPRPLSHESSALTTKPRLLGYLSDISYDLIASPKKAVNNAFLVVVNVFAVFIFSGSTLYLK
jgi:hypothetical protein